jgi:hypothetical protein
VKARTMKIGDAVDVVSGPAFKSARFTRDADNLMALFGERAYSAALARARHEDENGGDPSHWFAVRREIARRLGKD